MKGRETERKSERGVMSAKVTAAWRQTHPPVPTPRQVRAFTCLPRLLQYFRICNSPPNDTFSLVKYENEKSIPTERCSISGNTHGFDGPISS